MGRCRQRSSEVTLSATSPCFPRQLLQARRNYLRHHQPQASLRRQLNPSPACPRQQLLGLRPQPALVRPDFLPVQRLALESAYHLALRFVLCSLSLPGVFSRLRRRQGETPKSSKLRGRVAIMAMICRHTQIVVGNISRLPVPQRMAAMSFKPMILDLNRRPAFRLESCYCLLIWTTVILGLDRSVQPIALTRAAFRLNWTHAPGSIRVLLGTAQPFVEIRALRSGTRALRSEIRALRSEIRALRSEIRVFRPVSSKPISQHEIASFLYMCVERGLRSHLLRSPISNYALYGETNPWSPKSRI